MNVFLYEIHSCHTTVIMFVAMETIVTSIVAHPLSNEFCHEGGERLVM